MAEQVRAFKASDGSLHETREGANKADAEAILSKLFRGSAPDSFRHYDATFSGWMIDHAKAICAALEPIAHDPGHGIEKHNGGNGL